MSVPGVEHADGLAVRLSLAVHGTNHAEVIGALGDFREEFAHPQAALAMLPELPRRPHQLGLARGRRIEVLGRSEWQTFSAAFLQFGTVIERIDVRRAAVHEQEDHAFGSGSMMRRLSARGLSDPRESQRTEPAGGAPQQLSPRAR